LNAGLLLEGKERVMAHPQGFRWSFDFLSCLLGKRLAPPRGGEPCSSSTFRSVAAGWCAWCARFAEQACDGIRQSGALLTKSPCAVFPCVEVDLFCSLASHLLKGVFSQFTTEKHPVNSCLPAHSGWDCHPRGRGYAASLLPSPTF